MSKLPKKPIQRDGGSKARRIELPPPDDLNEEQMAQWKQMQDDEPEYYRQGNFFVIYDPKLRDSTIVDLNGKTFLRHRGNLHEITVLLNALQTVRAQNDERQIARVYQGSFEELEDEEFVETGFDIMDEIMATVDEDIPDIDPDAINNMLNSLQTSFLNDLIKPSKGEK